MSAAELRMRVYETADRLGGTLENAADEIQSKSSDAAVRRRAILWKADGIPALYAAAFRPDPLAGGFDLWVLLVQMDLYFTDGAGRAAFGAEQPLALAAVQQMKASAEQTAALVSASPEQLARRRAEVEEFARAHPIEGSFSGRTTATVELARFFERQDLGAFAVVGQAGDTLEDLSLRLGSYSTLLPKEIRWQGETARHGSRRAGESSLDTGRPGGRRPGRAAGGRGPGRRARDRPRRERAARRAPGSAAERAAGRDRATAGRALRLRGVGEAGDRRHDSAGAPGRRSRAWAASEPQRSGRSTRSRRGRSTRRLSAPAEWSTTSSGGP